MRSVALLLMVVTMACVMASACKHHSHHHDHSHSHSDHDHSHSHSDHDHSHSHSHSDHDHDHSHRDHDHGEHHDHDHDRDVVEHAGSSVSTSSLSDVLIASGLTSILPILIIPVAASVTGGGGVSPDGLFMSALTAFASGAILMDSLSHVAPAFGSHSHAHGGDHHHHDDHSASSEDGSFFNTDVLWVFAGFLGFYGIHTLPHQSEDSTDSSHGHSHGRTSQPNNNAKKEGAKKSKKTHSKSNAALLSLFADFSHNVTDGLLLGLSSPSERTVTYKRAIAIMAHELPHELGDYAILSRCGWSLWSVVLSQIVTAIGNLAGCLIAVCATQFVTPDVINALELIVGGSFLYLGSVVLVGDLLRDAPRQSGSKIVTIIALLCGTQVLGLASQLQHWIPS